MKRALTFSCAAALMLGACSGGDSGGDPTDGSATEVSEKSARAEEPEPGAEAEHQPKAEPEPESQPEHPSEPEPKVDAEDPARLWLEQGQALLDDPALCDAEGSISMELTPIDEAVVQYVDDPSIRLALVSAELDFYDAVCSGDLEGAQGIHGGITATLRSVGAPVG